MFVTPVIHLYYVCPYRLRGLLIRAYPLHAVIRHINLSSQMKRRLVTTENVFPQNRVGNTPDGIGERRGGFYTVIQEMITLKMTI